VLWLIAEEGGGDSATLARRLGVSYTLMEAMLETLTREGYLQPVATTATVACEKCPLRRACLGGGRARLWQLSTKGRATLAADRR
jgi:DNA-binding IclR family transcriptional regulator